MAKNCKHDHECEQCVREEIRGLEAKLRELRAKLPAQTTTISICNHGCHGYCNHWLSYQPYYYTSGNAIYQAQGLTGNASMTLTAYANNLLQSGSDTSYA